MASTVPQPTPARRAAARAFAAFGAAILLHLPVAVFFAPPRRGAAVWIGSTLYFVGWAAWSWATARRLWRGKGGASAVSLLIAFFCAVALAVVITAALGNPDVPYNPHPMIWAAHALVVATYVAALVLLWRGCR